MSDDTVTAPRPSAIIYGCAGTKLTETERALFAEVNPLGFILFARNCEDPDQLSALVADLRASVGRKDAPVLIDQEGGRVQRLGPPHWPAYPPQHQFAELAETHEGRAKSACEANARLIAHDLMTVGIDVDCLPLLDVPVAGAHDVIGDRAFGTNPEVVAMLGKAVIRGLMKGGVTPIIKHIPGHGRAGVDSHKELPVVSATMDELRTTDFAPFAALNDAPWAMTAHVIYSAIDLYAPATLSKAVINDVIRGEMGFNGLLISDDVSMHALSGEMGERAGKSLAAGCDVVLHCNGDMTEMQALSAATQAMDDPAWDRYVAGRKAVGKPDQIDAPALEYLVSSSLARLT
ncbi:beta-N-acetylhexosaminidase [Rhodospirillales bacterium]|nr:beta-N-acetylhexosaminidase [Rhodospirillales bacterium]